MPSPRNGHTLTMVENGKRVLLFGGGTSGGGATGGGTSGGATCAAVSIRDGGGQRRSDQALLDEEAAGAGWHAARDDLRSPPFACTAFDVGHARGGEG